MKEAEFNLRSPLKARDFKRYFFGVNPFPAIAVPEDSPPFLVDREEVLKTTREVILSSVQSGKTQTLMIQGNTGEGKSHILKYVRGQINSQLGTASESKALAVYVDNPRNSFYDLYVEILNQLGETFLKSLAAKVISRYIRDYNALLESGLISNVMRGKVGQIRERLEGNPDALEDVLPRDSFRYLDFFYNVRIKEEPKFRIKEYLAPFFRILDQPSSSWKWLTGGDLAKQEREILEVNSVIGEHNAADAFHDFKLLLNTAGYRMFFILLDELEDLTELNATRRTSYYSDLRQLIDNNTEGMCLIACVTPSGFSEIQASQHPLYRRLLVNSQFLEPFNKTLAVDLIRAYVEHERVEFEKSESTTRTKINAAITDLGSTDPGIYPFTKEVLAKIQEIEEGNVGNMLTACRKVLDAAADKEMKLISDVGYVQTVLRP